MRLAVADTSIGLYQALIGDKFLNLILRTPPTKNLWALALASF